MTDQLHDITGWLASAGQQGGAHGAEVGNELFQWLYDDLLRMARGQMRKEHAAHTLSATALTHEAWFRMNEQTRTQWANRSHFLAVASTVMRRILVHHAVAKQAQKRDADLVSLTLAEHQPSEAIGNDLVAVHEALLAFEAIDARAARVVELKFFGGMENTEIAEALGISLATVKREWSVARAWLLRELSAG
jgi:RNA polymerase sigma factor (TIGR02999 family)